MKAASFAFDAEEIAAGIATWVRIESPSYGAAAVNRMMNLAADQDARPRLSIATVYNSSWAVNSYTDPNFIHWRSTIAPASCRPARLHRFWPRSIPIVTIFNGPLPLVLGLSIGIRPVPLGKGGPSQNSLRCGVLPSNVKSAANSA